MLKEISDVTQIRGEPRRRWFADKLLDLIVWMDERREIIGFQLCYRERGEECAVDWRPVNGLTHFRVDSGEIRPGRHKSAPVLLPRSAPAQARLAELFAARSADLEPGLALFVTTRLQDAPTPS